MKFQRRNTEPKEQKGRDAKRLFRRNQVIITALAVMIAAAGYLNYAGKRDLAASADTSLYELGSADISEEDLYMENQAASYNMNNTTGSGEIEEAESQPEDTLDLAEINSWDADPEVEAGETGLENPGEAVLTSGLTVADYIAGVQLTREQTRARNKETLNSIINNTNIEEAAKQEAIQNMIAMTAVSEKENAAETLLQAKGFSDPVVSLTNGKVDVVINASSITDQQRAQIEDIVKRKTEVPADSIVITLLNLDD
jgi:stage III sporulation protein AH